MLQRKVTVTATPTSEPDAPSLPARTPTVRGVIADRAAGALVGAASGDALGVGYEFVSPRLTTPPHMIGGGLGPYAPGEWSDDTQLLICVAEIAANGLDLTAETALDAIAQRYLAWFQHGATDIDAQTHLLLETIENNPEHQGVRAQTRLARRLRNAAAYFQRRTRRGAGNAVLPRTAIIGLTRLEDRDATAAAAREITALTHIDDLAADASVLWAEAIRRACTDPQIGDHQWLQRIHIEDGLDLIPTARRDEWAQWLYQARSEYYAPPADNTFVVPALQAAYAAITRVAIENRPTSAAHALELAITAAVQTGGDTDTIAATVGALMGAICGANAIPPRWLRAIHGWPGMRANDLRDLGIATAVAGLVGPEQMQKLLVSEVPLESALLEHLLEQ